MDRAKLSVQRSVLKLIYRGIKWCIKNHQMELMGAVIATLFSDSSSGILAEGDIKRVAVLD